MLILVTGGSCSGKSAFAEKLLAETGADTKKYYIATMDAADAESQTRVKRHRAQRAGKGFVTIEQARDVHLAVRGMSADTEMRSGKMLSKERQPEEMLSEEMRVSGKKREAGKGVTGCAALLECMSNLAANEMFGTGELLSVEMVVEKVCRDIAQLEDSLDVLVIVTNNVFEDGVQYEEGTKNYLRALGHINSWLAERAWQVYEVVAGIPVLWKTVSD